MIVTNVGGLKEMCPNGKVGYVVEPKPNEIKSAILKFFRLSNVDEMINNIKELKAQYSWSLFTKNLLSLMDSEKEEK